MRRSRYRATIELVLGVVASLLAAVTAAWPDWIELLTGVDPDRHNGGVEWLLVTALFASAVSLGADVYRLRRNGASARATTTARGATR